MKTVVKVISSAVLLSLVFPSSVNAELVNTIGEFREGAAWVPRGYGLIRNWYQAQGRLTCRYSLYGGATHFAYWGPTGNFAFKYGEDSARYARNYDLQVLIDDLPYALDFNDTGHYTFGYRSHCEIEGVKFRHELVLDGHAVYRRLTVLENTAKKKIRARIQQMNMKSPRFLHDHATGLLRAAVPRRDDRGRAVTNVVEIGCLTGRTVFPINRLRTRPECAMPRRCTNEAGEQVNRFLMDVVEPAEKFVFYLDLDRRAGEDPDERAIDRAYADYAAKYRDGAKLVTGDRLVGDFLTWGAAWVDALDAGSDGAIRASQTYWVWPWDEMFSADVLALMGRAEPVRKMLYHLKKHADAETFLPALFDSTFTTKAKVIESEWTKAVPGRKTFCVWNLMYVHLLYRYWLYTGDEKTKADCLPFARAMMNAFGSHVDRARTALPNGYHFRPDFPMTLDWRDGERSLVNASLYYQALRSFDALTGENHSKELAEVLSETRRTFWDAEDGYWMDTVEEPSGRPKPRNRRVHPGGGPFQMSAFARELAPVPAKGIAAYMKRHFNHGAYLAFHDFDDPGWFADGNQLGAYSPPEDLYYWDQHNLADEPAALADFRRVVRPHAEIATFPEGQNSDVMNADPRICSDNTGIKQFFTVKTWLVDALNLRLGWDADSEGLRFHPMSDGEPFAAENLHLRASRLTVRVTGKGIARDAVYAFDGKPLAAAFLPWSALRPGAAHMLEITFRK